MESNCVICAHEFSDNKMPCVTICGHDGVCSVCFARLRCLLRDFTCPMCKQELNNVICVDGKSHEGKTHADFEAMGDEHLPGFIYNHRARMFFPPSHYKKHIEPLWLCRCLVCKSLKRDIKALKTHYNAEHQLLLCGLCIEHKQSFPAEQRVYTQLEYERHLNHGDGDGSEGHPMCEFCRKRYYDRTALFNHLTKDHFACFICDRGTVKYKYYKDYKSLENHFRQEHYMCRDPYCLEQKFIAFETEIELRNHNMSYHPSLDISRSIPIYFRGEKRNQRERRRGGHDQKQSQDQNQTRGEKEKEKYEEDDVAAVVEQEEWQVEVMNMIRPNPGHEDDEGMEAATYGILGDPELQTRIEDFPSLQSQRSSSRPWGQQAKGGKKTQNREYPALPKSSGDDISSVPLRRSKSLNGNDSNQNDCIDETAALERMGISFKVGRVGRKKASVVNATTNSTSLESTVSASEEGHAHSKEKKKVMDMESSNEDQRRARGWLAGMGAIEYDASPEQFGPPLSASSSLGSKPVSSGTTMMLLEKKKKNKAPVRSDWAQAMAAVGLTQTKKQKPKSSISLHKPSFGQSKATSSQTVPSTSSTSIGAGSTFNALPVNAVLPKKGKGLLLNGYGGAGVGGTGFKGTSKEKTKRHPAGGHGTGWVSIGGASQSANASQQSHQEEDDMAKAIAASLKDYPGLPTSDLAPPVPPPRSQSHPQKQDQSNGRKSGKKKIKGSLQDLAMLGFK